MTRRFVSVLVLVFMFEWPFFQSTLMMVMSTFNLAYLIGTKPMKTKFANFLIFFNELSIALFSHLMTTLLNLQIPESLF